MDDKETIGIKASMALALEVCVFSQALCVFVAFLMATRNQMASVILSAIACALSFPSIGIVILSLADRNENTERVGFRESVLEAGIAIIVSLACMFTFFPRFDRFSEKNPYSNKETLQCVVEFVIGQKFVVPGSLQSDGLIMKVPEGKEVVPPTVFPKPGLTFIGWRYAGTGDPDIAVGTPIYLDANGTRNNSVTLYAEYVDAKGNTYCACGAVGEGEFDGASWQGMNTRTFLMAFIPLTTASIVGIITLIRKGKGKGERTSMPDDETGPMDEPSSVGQDDEGHEGDPCEAEVDANGDEENVAGEA